MATRKSKTKQYNGVELTEVQDTDPKFIGMSLERAYLQPKTNLRILTWNGTECLIVDTQYDENRLNVALVKNIVTELYGRG